ncbi:Bifunctional ligase/repressor BirA [bacterium HR39]|nr:Bifunctional ligase/repressor BirA [bacterium HR39]
MALAVRIERHGAVASTNDIALARARAGEPEGLMVVAPEQLAGRGRHGRSWHSPPGNLHASLLLRPELPLARCASLALVAGLALSEAVTRVAPQLAPHLVLEWPNDLLLRGAKLAGVLLEAAGAHGREGIVIGMGVNVARHPEGLDRPATSLRAQGCTADVETLLEALAAAFPPLYALWLEGGFAAIAPAYRALLHGVGRPVRVRRGGEVLEGVLRGVDDAGALVVECAGRTVTLTSGEVERVRIRGGGS